MKTIQIVAALIESRSQTILLARRRSPPELAGMWEFPGGKIEDNENPETALRREIREELGLEIGACVFFMRTIKTESNRVMDMQIFRVLNWQGQATGKEGQEIVWAPRDSLSHYQMPILDQPIATALSWPQKILITPEPFEADHFLEKLAHALTLGVAWVHLRSRKLSSNKLKILAKEVRNLTFQHGVKASFNNNIALALELGFDGAHFPSNQTHSFVPRNELPKGFLLGMSCHHAIDIQTANKIGFDYVFISPIKKTTSHPEQSELKWTGFRTLLEKSNGPAFALGGLSNADLKQAINAGALGIASISAFWPS